MNIIAPTPNKFTSPETLKALASELKFSIDKSALRELRSLQQRMQATTQQIDRISRDLTRDLLAGQQKQIADAIETDTLEDVAKEPYLSKPMANERMRATRQAVKQSLQRMSAQAAELARPIAREFSHRLLAEADRQAGQDAAYAERLCIPHETSPREKLLRDASASVLLSVPTDDRVMYTTPVQMLPWGVL